MSEGIDVNKTMSAIDVLLMSMNLNDFSILNIKASDYRWIISLISKDEAIKLLQNADLTGKKLKIIKSNLFSYIKMGKEILMFGNIDIEKK